jgi:hypothetical protein
MFKYIYYIFICFRYCTLHFQNVLCKCLVERTPPGEQEERHLACNRRGIRTCDLMPAIALTNTAAVRFSLPVEIAQRLYTAGSGKGGSDTSRSASESCILGSNVAGIPEDPLGVGGVLRKQAKPGGYVHEIRRLAQSQSLGRELGDGGSCADEEVCDVEERFAGSSMLCTVAADVDDAAVKDDRWGRFTSF